jgi:hypothetical protein
MGFVEVLGHMVADQGGPAHPHEGMAHVSVTLAGPPPLCEQL